ncbi:hypothetical protein CJ214_03780 [Peptoniphilus lacrimalis]|uniref:Uncharacterized protein n=4 Tax=Gardnerella TaxID=2701 RepID=T2PJV5_9BIFI|nr:hypothetical protein HMPREF1576_00673 [Gardnerella pickettii JCP7719]EPI51707.1 hypothetical protein HMPREF1577_00996 [Gardnerella pickettii JCP8017A]EPI54863.1 hypothetical protein HMPREF1574_00916 [Gardnerella pickettii JCP7659]EPI60237.1 hypothetical protein HMPREF1578_01169 [Gardnerella pickettii JCP8017B]PKZ39815.1 hypothetical protein CYJ69_00040 [Gardnerella pickettii]PMC46113.1 hypothetical protein CJ214_03780 [Peptoniphilus lacrimalis]RFT24515.1 hypothetical protein CG392_06715 [G
MTDLWIDRFDQPYFPPWERRGVVNNQNFYAKLTQNLDYCAVVDYCNNNNLQ